MSCQKLRFTFTCAVSCQIVLIVHHTIFFKKGTKISEVFHCSTYVLISNNLFYIRLFVHVVFISLDTRLQSIGKFYKKYSGLERVKGAIRSHNLWSALCKAI